VISHLFCGHSLNGMISLEDILSPLALRRDSGHVGNNGMNGALCLKLNLISERCY
jgi:hypothetical protein